MDKRDSWLMQVFAVFYGVEFMTRYWTTIRLPFCKGTVYYPLIAADDPFASTWEHVREVHEPMHGEQQRTAWGLFKSFMLYFFLPLPFFLSGRWYIEREPFLAGIKAGIRTVDEAVDVLHTGYLRPWPRKWMKEYFVKKLGENF